MGRNMNTRWWDVLYDMWHKEQQHLKHRTKGAAFGAPDPDCCDPERPSPREKRPISTRSAVRETPGSSSSSVKVPWVLNVQLAVSAELLLHSLSLFSPSFSTFFFSMRPPEVTFPSMLFVFADVERHIWTCLHWYFLAWTVSICEVLPVCGFHSNEAELTDGIKYFNHIPNGSESSRMSSASMACRHTVQLTVSEPSCFSQQLQSWHGPPASFFPSNKYQL